VSVLIAVPVYNELKYVGKVLDKILSYWPQVLVIDDGSTDGTGDVLETRSDIRLIRHRKNKGYGQSLIDAFKYADKQGFDWIVTMDCDEQHEPEMIPEFIHQISTNQWDLISGSRYLQTRLDDDLPPGDRRTINRTITTVVNELFHLGITDSFCGFKAHRVSAMRRLRLTETGYAFPLQLWPQVAAAEFRVSELAVRLIYNDPNRSFGGGLDDAGERLRHYMEVLRREMEYLKKHPLSGPADESLVAVGHVCSDESCCCASK